MGRETEKWTDMLLLIQVGLRLVRSSIIPEVVGRLSDECQDRTDRASF
jgi:hypothetical protein